MSSGKESLNTSFVIVRFEVTYSLERIHLSLARAVERYSIAGPNRDDT